MKKAFLFLSVAFVALLSVSLNAQTKQAPKKDGDFAKVRAEKLKSELGLNDAQYTKIYNHFKECEANKPERNSKDSCAKKENCTKENCSKDVKGDKKGAQKGDKRVAHKKKEERTALNQKNQECMKSVLTPDQYTKWLEMSQKGGQKGGKGAPRGERPQAN